MKRGVLLVLVLIAAIAVFLLGGKRVTGRAPAAAAAAPPTTAIGADSGAGTDLTARGAASPQSPSSQPLASPTLSDGIIMSGGSAVDIQWTAATYASEDFKKWQLRRDTVPGTGETVVFESAQTATLIRRDTVPVPGARYRYTIWHDECWWVPPWPYTKVCDWHKKSEMEVDTSALRGWVTSDLAVAAGTYTGWLIVNPGAKLSLRPGTTINGSSYFYGGGLEMEGVTLAATDLRFGKAEDGTSGSGGLRGCTFLGESSIRLYGASQGIEVSSNTSQGTGLSIRLYDTSSALITGNTGTLNVSLDGTAAATVTDNALTAIVLSGANDLVAERNTLSDAVFVWGAGSVAEVRRNTFITDDPTFLGEEGHGIVARTGTRVTAEDNTLINTDPSEYGIMTIQAEGDAVLIARRNRVVGAIAVTDDVDATLTDNVITKVGLAVSATRAREITGNTIGSSAPGSPTRHATFYKTVPAAALITNNCFRNLSLWVNVEGPRSGYLNLRGNYWGDASGPRTSANPGGSGVPLGGAYYALWDPFDRVGAMCRDEPPPPPVEVGSLELTVDPQKLVPDGSGTAWITVRALDRAGAPAAGAAVTFDFDPAIGRWAAAASCTTGSDGRCRVQYVAPAPAEAAGGVAEVVFYGGAGGQTGSVKLELDYLKLVKSFPAAGVRNVDWSDLLLAAEFDRRLRDGAVGEQTFVVRSAFYYDRLPCGYGQMDKAALCSLEAALRGPQAGKGLRIKVWLKGGPDGLRGVDGAFLAQDVGWTFYTTPQLAPSIVATQVSDGADLIAGKPALVRVLGGLGDDTELDWVEADVRLSYPGGSSFERKAHRYYPGQGGLNAAYLRGNSANFASRAGEMPIVAAGTSGEYALSATVTPANQLDPPGRVPRRYDATAVVRVRPVAALFSHPWIVMYPIVPESNPTDPWAPYPWAVGQAVYDALRDPVVSQAAYRVLQWSPLRGVGQTVRWRAVSVWAPDIVAPSERELYLARLVRHADFQIAPLTRPGGFTMLLAPRWWLRALNGGGSVYTGPAERVCLVSIGADLPDYSMPWPNVTAAWCLGHLYGLADAGEPWSRYTLRGYDLDRDRLVDSALEITGYERPVMGLPNLGDGRSWSAWPGLWMDTADYGRLMDLMGGSPTLGSAVAAAPAESLTVGGEVVRTLLTVESARLDIAELPARGAFPAPGGGGDYALRLRGAGAAVLAEYGFAPEFHLLREGIEYASFLFNVPAPAGVRSVELRRGAVVLGTLAASANPPTVAVGAPAGGSYSGTLEVRWTGSDADAGAELRYTVLISPDNGATWQLVTLSTAGQALAVDTEQYPNCTACRVKVIAHDGFHSAEAISAPFAIANPPLVVLTWPPDGATDAGIRTEVSASFRDAMDASTITASSFTLVDAAGRPITGTVAYDAQVSEATLTPAAPLAYGQQYLARLAGTVKDAGGRPLGADVAWRFTVERTPITGVYLPLLSKK